MNHYDNKAILITGGTGSFGKNFTKFLLKNPLVKRVTIFSRDEFKQHYMQKELTDPRLRFFIGDVRDLPRLERAFQGVDIVIHAAALKHIPALEYNPFEAVKTNIMGTQNVIEAAIDQKVAQVLLISTDKAAQPTNLYGATKLCAEKLFVSGNSYTRGKTTFSAVRYGNVIGSRGSIVEMLLENKGSGKVPITDLEMTRFWITFAQSFQLVTFALENMEGGEIFVPKIPSMKLIDLFNILAPGVEKEVIGIRPGEKLHEVLLTEHESRHTIELSDYFVILPEFTHFSGERGLYGKYKERGQKLDSKFSFVSHTNEKWLTSEELILILKEASLEL
jgi:UDP-N-acetylglucosamine 4,6-dehydratase